MSLFSIQQVSNVIPKGNWLRKASEIALATRRDSKWERVD